jgi:hypothetical protein
MNNVRGIFPVEIDGTERDAKCTFGLVERLERSVLKRPIIQALNEAAQGLVYTSDIVAVIHEALKENGDTRLTQKQIGEYVFSKGSMNYLEWYIVFLTFALTGETEPSAEEVSEEDKKK